MENLGEFIINHWILCTAFVVLVWIVFSDALQQKLSGVKQVATSEAIRLVNQQKAQIIDVREASEFSKEHIADSSNMPASSLADKIADLKNTDQPIILVCLSGQRSRSAAKVFRSKGFSNLYSLQGGLNAWKEAKLPLFS
jgi:rhodanese-related sulfurtransferase